MSKYIRTKDGIYEVDELNEKNLNSNVIDIYNCLGLETQIRKCDIIKQSDNLAELCDEFVYEMGLEHTLVTIGYEQIRDNILTCELLDMSNLYSAIWTDKGLIYVAKMNEDGELVLI